MKKVDVTILGGGPVGSFLATILNDMGVSNLVIDRDLIPYQLPRAIVLDDEILRACYDHGMGEWLQLNTEPLRRGDFVGPNDEVVIGADIPPIGLQAFRQWLFTFNRTLMPCCARKPKPVGQ